MTQILEVNLADVLNRLEIKIDHLQSDMTDVKIDTEKLKSQNEQIVKRLESVDKRFDSVDKRFDNVENRLNSMTIGFFGIVDVLVTGLLGIIGKLAFFPNL